MQLQTQRGKPHRLEGQKEEHNANSKWKEGKAVEGFKPGNNFCFQKGRLKHAN